MASSTYLEKDRLAQIIAAIQIMGTSDWPSGSLNRWVSELEAGAQLTPKQLGLTPIHFGERKKWAAVFEQHPEFFKTFTVAGEERVALRWRFSQSVNSNGKTPAATAAVAAAATAAPADDKATDVGWTAGDKAADDTEHKSDGHPLTPEQISVLMTAAIELHSRAVAEQDILDRFGPALITAVGALIGAVIGGGTVALFMWSPLTRIFD
jgi:hypothetical protein